MNGHSTIVGESGQMVQQGVISPTPPNLTECRIHLLLGEDDSCIHVTSKNALTGPHSWVWRDAGHWNSTKKMWHRPSSGDPHHPWSEQRLWSIAVSLCLSLHSSSKKGGKLHFSPRQRRGQRPVWQRCCSKCELSFEANAAIKLN